MKKSDKTRIMLLETASRIIAHYGIDKVTSRLLAKQADVSPGLIAHYFNDNSVLFPEVVDYIFETADLYVRDESLKTALERLLYATRMNFLFFVIDNPHYYKCLLLSYYYVGINKRISKIHEK